MRDVRRSGAVRWLFPLLASVVFVLLVAAGINGSSIGVLFAPDNSSAVAEEQVDPALLIGQPRAIRSDEWSIATPNAISQSLQDFPDRPWIGLTRTNPQSFPYSLPTSTFSVAAKPQVWGYLLLGPERGLSWSWWLPFLVTSVALYWLVLFVTGRISLAIGASLIGTFTPYVAWWTSPSPNLLIGFAALMMLAAGRALAAVTVGARVGWAMLLGWATSAAVLVLYPPWTVSTGLVAAAFVLGLLVDLRPGVWRVAVVGLTALGAMAVSVIPWFLSITESFEAINATIYPGQRRSASGEAMLQPLLSAPANIVVSTTGQGPAILNQSEVASTWLAVGLLVLLVPLMVSVGRRGPDSVSTLPTIGRGTVFALSGVILLLAVWMLVPGVPTLVGEVTLLNRVPGGRASPALGLAVFLLVVALSRLAPARVKPVVAVIALASAFSAAAAVYAARHLYPSMGAAGLVVTAVGGALMTWAFGSIATGVGRRATLPVAAAYAVVSFAVVNPLYAGLGPLANDPVARYARSMAAQEPGTTAVTLGGMELQALVRGGGLQVMSWTTQYPDRAFWEEVMPGREDVWNNYRNYTWHYDPEAAPIEAAVTAADSADLFIDLCSPQIRDLGFARVFSPEVVDAPCLEEDRVIARGQQQIYVYRSV